MAAFSTNPVLYSDVDLTKLSFAPTGRVLKAKGGGSSTVAYNATYNDAPLYVRFPAVISTIGLRPSQYSTGKYSITINFTNVDPFIQEAYGAKSTDTPESDPFFGQGQLYNFLQQFEHTLIGATTKNSMKWLGAPSLTEERAKQLWTPIVKPHKNKVTDSISGEYPPITTLDVNTDGGKFDIYAIDATNKKPINPSISDMMAVFKAPVRFRGVFVFNGVFVNNNRLSATFTMVYAEVMPSLEMTAIKRSVALVLPCFDDLPDEAAARKFERTSEEANGSAAGSKRPRA